MRMGMEFLIVAFVETVLSLVIQPSDLPIINKPIMKIILSNCRYLIFLLIFFQFISCRRHFEKEIVITEIKNHYDLRNAEFPKKRTDLINIKILENNCLDTVFINGGMVRPNEKYTLNNNPSIMNSGDLFIYNPKKIRCKIKIEYFWYDPFSLFNF